jgi:NADH-quinone oxidoreductase subunit L
MTGPLVLLAVLSVALGLPAVPTSYGVSRWLDAPSPTRGLDMSAGPVLLTTAIALLAVVAVLALHRRRPQQDPVAVLGRLAVPLAHAFWIDEIYDRLLVRPTHALARAVLAVDRRGIDAAVVGTATATRGLGGGLRRVQNGNIQTYASGLVIGVLAVVIGVSLAVAR